MAIVRHTGKTYRLLTAAVWEYVARARTTTNYAFGDKITGEQARLSERGTVQRWHKPPRSVRSQPTGSAFTTSTAMWGNGVEDCWNANYLGAPVDGTAHVTVVQ